MTRKATATDVALEAGVSKWTVGRAFTPGTSIAQQSRERVMQAAEKLGYRPNLLARSLTTKSTHQVAVLVDDFANSYKLSVLALLTAALQAEGMVAMLININRNSDPAHAFLTADQRQVDAVILLGTAFPDETLRENAMKTGSPQQFILARESTIDSIPAVSCDAAASMKEIGSYLLQKGYRRPGFMSGPRSLSTALGRQRHFASFWRRHGVPHVPELPAGSYDRHAAACALRSYLQATPAEHRIDVLMCENDELALGAIDIARSEFGLRVPDDFAVVGYDGTDLATAPSFNLTTYQQPMEEMVAALVDMLMARREVESVSIPGKLIIRGST